MSSPPTPAPRRRLIDLSRVIEHGMITDPRLPTPVVRDVWTREQSASRYAPGVSFQIASVELVQNTGTYLDAPFHRHEGMEGVWDIGLERLADLSGVCVDARSRVDAGERAMGPETFSGVDVRGRAVLLCTGFDARWDDAAYRDGSHPHLTEAGARALVEGGAALFGIDAINADAFDALARPAHSLLLGAGAPIVENLVGLDALVGRAFHFTAAPARIKGLGSFPVRAYAAMED